MKTKLFALADCNNFFASCERVFNPALRDKPVVVLSNNDGCVIARSNEAKAIGIGMGEPYFKCQGLIAKHQVKVYSANFVLYGDMSSRVMNTLAQFTPALEVYSIDEAFLSLDGLSQDAFEYMKLARQRVKRDTGMPVSIGVAPTKTLAKIANRIAKKNASDGVFCLLHEEAIVYWLAKIEVEDIWGIGREKAALLRRHGIDTALQLRNAPDDWVKERLTVVTLKTVWELRGISCLELEEEVADKQSISTSRTFGSAVTSQEQLVQAVSAYIGKAAEKLRLQQSMCGYLQVYVTTDRFKEAGYYAKVMGIDVTPPTAYTPTLIAIANQLVAKIYKPGYLYKKAGVVLGHLQSAKQEQQFLFDEGYQGSRKECLMKTIDQFNQQTNYGKIFIASQGVKQPWFMKQSYKSQRFTTRWDEILEIHI